MLISLLLLAFCILVSGCSDGKLKTYPVSGVVTMNGEPVDGATVTFSPVKENEGDAAIGKTNEKGEYNLQTANGRADGGTTPGNYIVMIKKSEAKATGRIIRDSSGNSSEEKLPISVLPAQYGSFSSPFKATVENKKNVFDFKLEN